MTGVSGFMKQSDEMSKIIDRLRSFSKERDWSKFHTEKNLSMSIAIEAAELMELYQWSTLNMQVNGTIKNVVCEELADVFIYCIMLADKLDIDINTIINAKIDINELKYPIDKSKGNSKKYCDF